MQELCYTVEAGFRHKENLGHQDKAQESKTDPEDVAVSEVARDVASCNTTDEGASREENGINGLCGRRKTMSVFFLFLKDRTGTVD